MLLLVCMVDPGDIIGFALGVGELGTEFLVNLFKTCDFAV